MAITYEPIATQTLSSTQNQIDFTSIPQTYTDLLIVMQGGLTGSADIWLRMNSDTGSNYSRTRISGDGSAGAGASTRNSAAASIFLNAGVVGAYAVCQVHILNYSNTVTYKSTLSRFGSSAFVVASAGLWRSTSAITTLTLKAETADTFTSGSTFTLYGIKAA